MTTGAETSGLRTSGTVGGAQQGEAHCSTNRHRAGPGPLGLPGPAGRPPTGGCALQQAGPDTGRAGPSVNVLHLRLRATWGDQVSRRHEEWAPKAICKRTDVHAARRPLERPHTPLPPRPTSAQAPAPAARSLPAPCPSPGLASSRNRHPKPQRGAGVPLGVSGGFCGAWTRTQDDWGLENVTMFWGDQEPPPECVPLPVLPGSGLPRKPSPL